MSARDFLKRLAGGGAQCVYCGREVQTGRLTCGECLQKEKALLAPDGRAGGVPHVFRYEDGVRRLIHRLKYDDMPRYAFYIAQRMYEFLDGSGITADVLTFVPVHVNRLRERGYDQSELIASRLSLLLEIPCRRLLDRVRETKPQFMLGADERAKNTEGAFAPAGNMDIGGKSVLLIDDIYTSGATMGACVKCLAEAGANVVPFAFCREY